MKEVMIIEFIGQGGYYLEEMKKVMEKLNFFVWHLGFGKNEGSKTLTLADIKSFVGLDPGHKVDVILLDLSLLYQGGYKEFAELLQKEFKAKVIFTGSTLKEGVVEFQPYFQKQAMHQKVKEELATLVKSVLASK